MREYSSKYFVAINVRQYSIKTKLGDPRARVHVSEKLEACEAIEAIETIKVFAFEAIQAVEIIEAIQAIEAIETIEAIEAIEVIETTERIETIAVRMDLTCHNFNLGYSLKHNFILLGPHL